MKKKICLLLTFAMLFLMTACGRTNEAPTSEPSPSPKAESGSASAEKNDTHGKTLIVYFSWSPSGNTEKMANTIKEHTGGDILRIEPKTAYPTDYSKCGEVAKAERDANARPEISNLPTSIDEYDTVFIGYPIWWHTAPMIIGTFLESYNLSSKEIYPFSQSASMDTEHFSNSMNFVRSSANGATVHDGLFANSSDTDKILAYLTENGF